MSKFVSILFFSLFVVNPSVFGHSIQIDITRHAPLVSVKASYSPTSPLADVGIKVYAPEEDHPFQTGHTDKQGYFVFYPTTPGNWVYEIDDQHGHKKRTTISIDENFLKGVSGKRKSREEGEEEKSSVETVKEEKKTAPPSPEEKTTSIAEMPFVYKLILGLALIFGVTGFYYGMSSRKSLKKRD